LLLVGFSTTGRAEENAEVAADNLKYSRDFYSKVHFVAIAKLDFGAGGTAEFKYDRYPNGGPERIQAGDNGEFARKDGKTWLKSNDWGETGKPVDAQTAKRLNNWVGLIDSRLNGEPASNDPSEGATVMKFLSKETDNEREEFVFEESKEKPKAKSYPHISFGRFKDANDQQVLLSEFSGPMQLGAREAKVKISFSHLVAVQIKDETNAAESPSPTAGPRSGGLESAVTESASPTAEESDGDLVNRGIEKAKNGDLDGALADFDRAIKLNPKDDAPYYNRAQAKRLKKDTAGAIADYTKAIELGSTNPAAYNNRGNARAENKDRDGAIADYTRAIELKPDYARAYYNRVSRRRTRVIRPVLRPTSRWLGNSIRNWLANSRPWILKTTVLRERQQSACLMASLSSTSRLISRATLMILKSQKPWPGFRARTAHGERSCAERMDSRRISLRVISKCA
jgi:tetratricopeptide (TPR) repeat protein